MDQCNEKPVGAAAFHFIWGRGFITESSVNRSAGYIPGWDLLGIAVLVVELYACVLITVIKLKAHSVVENAFVEAVAAFCAPALLLEVVHGTFARRNLHSCDMRGNLNLQISHFPYRGFRQFQTGVRGHQSASVY
jgi:hypothetical protein